MYLCKEIDSMNRRQQIRTIRNFIEQEKAMRKRVFGSSQKGTQKVMECDAALSALADLAEALGESQQPQAMTAPLFGSLA
jgi:hypothetical protein